MTTNQGVSDIKEAFPSYKEQGMFSWANTIAILAIHLLAIVALWHFTWLGLLLSIVLYVLTGFGITIGYHRLLTHRSFVAKPWLRNVFATLGSLAFEGGPILWTARHRLHHVLSDKPGDPHDISKGFWFAHMNWLFFEGRKSYVEEIRNRYARDLQQEPYLVWLENHPILPSILLGLALFAIGGLSAVLWGIFFRAVMVYHFTWMVNSVCHKWGYKSFPEATGYNNWLVAIVALGEGWHNNHHRYAASARNGFKAFEFDISWMVIVGLAWIGQVSGIKTYPGDPRRYFWQTAPV